MTLHQFARNLYRSQAHRYPGIFNWQQREVAVVKTRVNHIHDPDFGFLTKLPLPDQPFVVDVGANFGQSIGSIKTVLPQARIAAFEPNPLAFRKITRRYRLHKEIAIHNYALSDKTGRAELFTPSCRGVVFDQLATTGCQNATEIAAFLQANGFSWADSHSVTFSRTNIEVRTLDEFGFAPDVIKVDVEGSEYDVLQGGRLTIERFRPALLIESGNTSEIITLMRAAGYERYLYRDGRIIPAESAESLNSIFLSSAPE